MEVNFQCLRKNQIYYFLFVSLSSGSHPCQINIENKPIVVSNWSRYTLKENENIWRIQEQFRGKRNAIERDSLCISMEISIFAQRSNFIIGVEMLVALVGVLKGVDVQTDSWNNVVHRLQRWWFQTNSRPTKCAHIFSDCDLHSNINVILGASDTAYTPSTNEHMRNSQYNEKTKQKNSQNFRFLNSISVFLVHSSFTKTYTHILYTPENNNVWRESRHAKMDNFGFAKTDTLTLILFFSVLLCVQCVMRFACLSRLSRIFAVRCRQLHGAPVDVWLSVCFSPSLYRSPYLLFLSCSFSLCMLPRTRCLCWCQIDVVQCIKHQMLMYEQRTTRNVHRKLHKRNWIFQTGKQHIYKR